MSPLHMSPLHMSPLDVVDAFDEAWNARDLEAVLGLVTDDCVFESARVDRHGGRIVGREALREAWAPGFAEGGAVMAIEDAFEADGGRVVQLWCYGEGDDAVRGVDVLRIAEDRIAEKLGYVKVGSAQAGSSKGGGR